jgi:hypothetical protein
MARNTPLGNVLAMVKAESGKSLNTSATQADTYIEQVIADTQAWLASEYDWPFLEARWDIAIPPGSRYIAFPTTDDVGLTTAINFERAGSLRLYIKWNNIWQDVYYGITEIEEFNYIDSDRGQVLDPVQRWKFDDEGNFEIWPSNAQSQTLRFTGQRTLTNLQSSAGPPPVWDADALLDLDDLLVTYYVAAEIAAREDQQEIAVEFIKRGADRLRLVRATYPQREMPPVIVGHGQTYDRRTLRVVPMVVVGGK